MSHSAYAYIRLAVMVVLAGAILFVLAGGSGLSRLVAQQPDDVAGPSADPAPRGDESAAPVEPMASALPQDSINLWQLMLAGGMFMIPIFALSLLAGSFTIERFLGLRRGRVLPDPLVGGLGQLSGVQGTFDPRRAYKLCQEHPSAAANVIRAMLLKVGRPVAEVETTVAAASQREADKLYANVRWLNIAASLATMLGLIGTIQGMIMAFHQLTLLDAGTDRTQVLASGIYTALVTTFSGLAVAIPAAFFSHYFEGRIQSVFREIDELVFSLLPQLERYEGRLRFNRQAGDGEVPPTDKPPTDKPATVLSN
ncbi:MAG: MotA/TolQ/ExbB proton channel family protein [Pirellulaceae bacterium]